MTTSSKRLASSAKYLKAELPWVVTANGRPLAAFHAANDATDFASVRKDEGRNIRYKIEHNS